MSKSRYVDPGIYVTPMGEGSIFKRGGDRVMRETQRFARRVELNPPKTEIYDPKLGLTAIAIPTGRTDEFGRDITTILMTSGQALEANWYEPYFDRLEEVMADLDRKYLEELERLAEEARKRGIS